MTDPDRLREHLELYDNGMGVYDDTTPTTEALAEAARSYLRILEADDQLVEEAKFPYLDTLAMFASKVLQISHEEAMEREDIQEASTIVTRAVLARLGGNQ